MMNRPEADAIAVLVHQLRPDWDVRGVMAALGQCRDREPADVAIAAVKAASDRKNRTPAVIALAGPHWLSADRTTTQTPPALNALCSRHAKEPQFCPWCTGKLPEPEGDE